MPSWPRSAGPRVRPRSREDPQTLLRPEALAGDRAASRSIVFAIPASPSPTETKAYTWRKLPSRPASGPSCTVGMKGDVPTRVNAADTRRLRQRPKVSPKLRRELGQKTGMSRLQAFRSTARAQCIWQLKTVVQDDASMMRPRQSKFECMGRIPLCAIARCTLDRWTCRSRARS